MARTWGGWTKRRWRNELRWTIEESHYTGPAKCLMCWREKTLLKLQGEWDTLPADIQANLSFYALVHEKQNAGEREREAANTMGVIKGLRERRAALDEQIANAEKYLSELERSPE